MNYAVGGDVCGLNARKRPFLVTHLNSVQKLACINCEHGHDLNIVFEQPTCTMSRVFAYARVSTSDQFTNNQVAEIAAAGFEVLPSRLITETVSGSVAANQRPGFQKLLNKLEPDDILIVTKLDRLGRNAMDVRTTVESLATMGVRVHCLALGGVDLCSPAGKMTMAVIAAVAEFERDLLIERTQSGLVRAKSEGKTLGRPKVLSLEQELEAKSRIANGETITAVANALKTSRATVMRCRDQIKTD